MEKESPTNDSVDGSAQPQVAGAVDVAEVVMEPAMENGDLVRISERYDVVRAARLEVVRVPLVLVSPDCYMKLYD